MFCFNDCICSLLYVMLQYIKNNMKNLALLLKYESK